MKLLLLLSAVLGVSSFSVAPVRPISVVTASTHVRAAAPTLSLSAPAGFYDFATTLLAEVVDKPGDRER